MRQVVYWLVSTISAFFDWLIGWLIDFAPSKRLEALELCFLKKLLDSRVLRYTLQVRSIPMRFRQHKKGRSCSTISVAEKETVVGSGFMVNSMNVPANSFLIAVDNSKHWYGFLWFLQFLNSLKIMSESESWGRFFWHFHPLFLLMVL